MISSDLEFCFNCGSLKTVGKICKICTTIIKTKERTNFLRKLEQETDNNKIKREKAKKKTPKIKPSREVIRYSTDRGFEWDYDIDLPTIRRTRLNICIKCRKLKKEWEGIWVKAGGQYAIDDPEIRVKRVFLCGQCWSPSKKTLNDNQD
ncbi:MAG: hypothetical protein ACXAC7_19270 [Candidatus Hodarchaeales archaeon]|jgi:hypothetical protein